MRVVRVRDVRWQAKFRERRRKDIEMEMEELR